MNKKINKIIKTIMFLFLMIVGVAIPNISIAQDVICTADAVKCPDGTFVGRTGPDCEFICDGKKFIPSLSDNVAEREADRISLIASLREQISLLQAKIQRIIEQKIYEEKIRSEFKYKLKKGSVDRYTNNEVSKLQRFLISENVYPEKIISGYYGKLTSKAVKRLKEKYDFNKYLDIEWSPKVYSIIMNFKKSKDEKEKGTPEKYYKNLEKKCENSPFKSCCLDSVKKMELTKSKIATNSEIKDSQCSKGFEIMSLRCPGSFTWCQPEMTAIQLPSYSITEEQCISQGGEVWNTLGKTSYDGVLLGRINGLNCPCACLVRENAGVLWVNKDGNREKFEGNIKDIRTFDQCKKAGFKILDTKPEICQTGEPYMKDGKYQTFTNILMNEGKICSDYTYSNCPGSCVAKCIASSCSEPDENGAVVCTADCDGEGSCVELGKNTEEKCALNFPNPITLCGIDGEVIATEYDENDCVIKYGCK